MGRQIAHYIFCEYVTLVSTRNCGWNVDQRNRNVFTSSLQIFRQILLTQVYDRVINLLTCLLLFIKSVRPTTGVGAATDTGWTDRVRFQAVQRFSLPTASRPTLPSSFKISTVVYFPGDKRQGREADHSPPSSTKARNVGAIPPFPRMS
jgi:hypothetical protein